MPPGDLRKLWQLHQVDAAIYDIRARAAALDPGKKILAQIQLIDEKLKQVEANRHRLQGEQTDLELSQKSIDDKLAKIDADLYGGKVVNPREVENLQKEVETLKQRKFAQDERLIELMEAAEPVSEEAEKLSAAVDELKTMLADHQKRVMAEKARLEAAYKEAVAARPAALAQAPPVMLAKYDPLLKKLGTAMARVTKERTCEACGLALSEKGIEAAKEDRISACDQCHRILYYSEGIV